MDFNYKGKLLQPINFHGNDIEGVHHALMVHPEMRDKIIKAEFIPLEKLGSDDLLQQAMRQAEMTDQGYAIWNVPAKVPKTPVKSKFEIFHHLFLFGSYYLLYYPGKTVSFFDYLLFLMSQVNVLNLDGMLALDAGMQFEYAMQPDWNWNQQRIQLLTVVNQVLHNRKYSINYDPNHRQARQNPQNGRGGHGRGHRGRQSGKESLWEKLKNVVCEDFKTTRNCHYGKGCFKIYDWSNEAKNRTSCESTQKWTFTW